MLRQKCSCRKDIETDQKTKSKNKKKKRTKVCYLTKTNKSQV